MSIETTKSRSNRFTKFTSEMRAQTARELMAANRTTRQEYEGRPAHYNALGINSVDELHQCIKQKADSDFKVLDSFHNKMVPTRTKCLTILEREGLTEDQTNQLQRLVDMTNQQEQILIASGYVLDDSVTYQKLRKGNVKSTVMNLTSGFDDAIAEMSTELLEFELGITS